MSQRFIFSILLILWLASYVSADGGDDFANNLASDLGPIIALFGERVVMQFMSQAMGIADCILLAVAPIGAITTVVSAIRVAGPAWLKSFIGRARENLAAAEVEVMSSTSTETCELWNGNSVVRCPGSADIYQFICLIPKSKDGSTPDLKRFKVECKKLSAGTRRKAENNSDEDEDQTAENVQEETKLLKKSKRTGPPYILQGFKRNLNMMSNKLMQALPSPPRAARSIRRDLENQNNSSMRSSTGDSKCSSEEKSSSSDSIEIVVIEDKDGSAPNLLLNCHERVGRSTIYLAATIGSLLQLGAVIYFGIITYHKPTKNEFLKDGKGVVKYAFPCAAVGTVLLVLGLFICSWVVTKSTKETYYEAENHDIYIVWLQKDHTVSDQVFKPFAVYPTSRRDYITLSRRNIKYRPNEIGDLFLIMMNWLFKDSLLVETLNDYYASKMKMGDKPSDYIKEVIDQPLYWPLKSITFIGALISLIGFISQFIGMRGLNWTASIVQLGITMIVTILRVIVRRGLGKSPAHTSLNPKFELDWFVLSLEDFIKAPWAKVSHTSRDSDNRNIDTRDETSAKWEICTGGELTYHTADNESVKDSEPHRIMHIRKKLGEHSKWKSPIKQEADYLSKAIETIANTFLTGQSEVETGANTSSNGQSNVETGKSERPNDEAVDSTNSSRQSHGFYEWSIPAIYKANNSAELVRGNVYITISKDKQHGWRVKAAEIEAILSLWLYSASSTNQPDTRQPRSLRVYGPSESRERLIRDLDWWMPENIPQTSQYAESELVGLAQKRSECTIVGFTTGNGSAQIYTNTSAQNGDVKNYNVLECQDNQQTLFSRDLLFSFMRAIAKMPQVDTAIASSVQPLSSNTITRSQKEVKLRNEKFSDLARKLEKIGFGSLPDIYIDLIIPLSLEHKLTNAQIIIDDIAKIAHGHERSLQWKKLVDTCVYLLNFALQFDLEKESSGPRAIAICLGFLYRLYHEERLQYSEKRTEEEFTTQLGILKEKFNDEKIQSLAYIPAALTNELNFSAVSLSTLAGPSDNGIASFPDSFRISAESLEIMNESTRENKLQVTDTKGFGRTDAFGWSLLHYAANLTLDIGGSGQTNIGLLNARDLIGWTPLHHACFYGNEDLVNALLEQNAEIEIAGNDGITPMHCAVQCEKAKIIQILREELEKRQKKNKRKSEHYVDRNDRHPIHWAAVEGNVEMIRSMKDDIGLRDRFGWTALHLAALYEYEDILQYISEDHTKALDVCDNELRTPLHLAVEYDLTDAAQILIQAGAEENIIAKDGLTPFHMAIKRKQSQIVEIFLKYGTNMDVVDMEGRTPLYLSVEDGEIETIKKLIKKGTDVSAARRDGRTPLHVALSRGQEGLEIAKILLEAHADMNAKAEDGATGMHIAAEYGILFEIGDFLAEIGPGLLDIDATDEFGQTPLLITIYKADWKAAKLLLDMGASVNADKRIGYTPVLGAVISEDIDILLQLLDKGASVDDADEDGYSALHIAILNRNQEIVQALLNANASADAVVSGRYDTPLHIAVGKGQTNIVQTLLDRGANTTLLNFRGFSPLQQALYSGNFESAQILLGHDKKSITKVVSQRSETGDTLLHTLSARSWDDEAKCKILEDFLSIATEIDINAKNLDGFTPLDFALSEPNKLFITKMLKYGAEPGTKLSKRLLEGWKSENLN